MGKRSSAAADPVLTFQSERMMHPEPITFDEEPETVGDRVMSIMDVACTKGSIVDVKARAHIVQRSSINDANIEVCGVVVTLGDSMYVFALHSPMHHFTLMGPKDKSDHPTWMKSVQTNIDMGAVFKSIETTDDEVLREWKEQMAESIILTSKEQPKKKRKVNPPQVTKTPDGQGSATEDTVVVVE